MRGFFTISAILAISGVMAAAPATSVELQGDLGMLFHVEARDGHKDNFEAGYKRHLEWHRLNKDRWPWPAWEIVTGPRAGNYLEGTFGHSQLSLDRRLKPDEDAADHKKNVNPHVSRHEQQMLVRKGAVSRGRPLEDVTPSPFLQILTFELKPGMEGKFEELLAAMHGEAKHAGWHETYAWYALVDSGTRPTYLLVIPIANREGGLGPAPSEKTIANAVAGNANPQERERKTKIYRDSVLSVRSELVRFREDLSYFPKIR